MVSPPFISFLHSAPPDHHFSSILSHFQPNIFRTFKIADRTTEHKSIITAESNNGALH